MSDLKLFTQKPEECRQQAQRSLSPDEKASWLDLAREWQTLADLIASSTADTERK
jgi:hypothetical protein